MTEKTPKQIVAELDTHIIGQLDAKKAVAIALRNRYRRRQVVGPMREEITPKNILMIGPTGVGKTEIARRLAKLCNAPFVKVEASKFTEVGYVGRDVETIVRDLADTAYKMVIEEMKEAIKPEAEQQAEEKLLDALLRRSANTEDPNYAMTRDTLRERLRNGEFDDKEINIDLPQTSALGNMEIAGPPGMEEITDNLRDMIKRGMREKKTSRRLTVAEARRILTDDACEQLVDDNLAQSQAIERAEQDGIVFIDEIDKIARANERSGADVSREGVQRDLLPIVEGTSVKTKLGMVKTDHVLFIASGAFHQAKPSDLIAELQGRFPIRVELSPLGADEFVRILEEPKGALTKQYAALMATEDVTLTFSKQALRRIAEIAYQVNDRIENIGARRLHTIMEKLLEHIAFDVPDNKQDEYLIDRDFVEKQLKNVYDSDDLSRYIL